MCKKDNISKNLKLVLPTKEYEKQVMELRKVFLENNEAFHGCAGLEEVSSYTEWTDFDNRLSKKYGENYVPSTVYLAIRISDNKLVGIIDIRNSLTDFLYNYGGNIGYSVLPEERRKGYAKEMLSLTLLKCKDMNMERVLLTCDKENIASAKTIQANGGILENEVIDKVGLSKSKYIQRYWISLSKRYPNKVGELADVLMEQITIRNVKNDDIEDFLNLYIQVSEIHQKARPDIFKKHSKEDLIKILSLLIEDKNNIILLAEDINNCICGVLIAKLKLVENHINLKNSKILWIDDLIVDESCRRKGVGKVLMQKAKKIALEMNCSRIDLNVWNFNVNAIDFYKSIGMETQRRILELNIEKTRDLMSQNRGRDE